MFIFIKNKKWIISLLIIIVATLSHWNPSYANEEVIIVSLHNDDSTGIINGHLPLNNLEQLRVRLIVTVNGTQIAEETIQQTFELPEAITFDWSNHTDIFSTVGNENTTVTIIVDKGTIRSLQFYGELHNCFAEEDFFLVDGGGGSQCGSKARE